MPLLGSPLPRAGPEQARPAGHKLRSLPASTRPASSPLRPAGLGRPWPRVPANSAAEAAGGGAPTTRATTPQPPRAWATCPPRWERQRRGRSRVISAVMGRSAKAAALVPCVLATSSQVASNPLRDHFRTQKIVSKMEFTRGGLRTQKFWQLFRFWVLKWVLKWYLPPLEKTLKIIQNLIYWIKALFDLIWPSVYRATSMCSEMESMSHRCWITLWYMRETILEPFPPPHKKKLGHSRSMCFQINN